MADQSVSVPSVQSETVVINGQLSKISVDTRGQVKIEITVPLHAAVEHAAMLLQSYGGMVALGLQMDCMPPPPPGWAAQMSPSVQVGSVHLDSPRVSLTVSWRDRQTVIREHLAFIQPAVDTAVSLRRLSSALRDMEARYAAGLASGESVAMIRADLVAARERARLLSQALPDLRAFLECTLETIQP